MVLLELRVCRQNGKRFVLGLGNQHAIEGIAMMIGEGIDVKRVRLFNGQRQHAFLMQAARHVAGWGLRQDQFAQPALDGDFPGASSR